MPLRSFCSTLVGLLEPWRFWQRVRQESRQSPPALLGFLALLWLCAAILHELQPEYNMYTRAWVIWWTRDDASAFDYHLKRLFFDRSFSTSWHWTSLQIWPAVLITWWLCAWAACGAIRHRSFTGLELFRVVVYSVVTVMLLHTLLGAVGGLLSPLNVYMHNDVTSPMHARWRDWYGGLFMWRGRIALACGAITFIWGSVVALRLGLAGLPWGSIVLVLFGYLFINLLSAAIRLSGSLELPWVQWIHWFWWRDAAPWLAR